MSRRAVVLILAGVLLGVLGWWITSNFGVTKQRVFVGWRGEARHNPYFAAALLLERMGKSVTRQAHLASVEEVPEGVALFLPRHLADLDPPGVQALLAWVERGGYLVLGVESVPWEQVPEPLLEALGVRVEEEDEEEKEKEFARPGPPPPEELALPDGTQLHADFFGSPILTDAAPPAQARYTGPHGHRILVYERGRGRILVVASLFPFNNHSLNEADHATLLWHLFSDAGPRIVMVNRLYSVSLLEWLVDHALPALVALGVLVALWLWRVVPRFGPLLPSDATPRRSLVEHLRAVGRFQADSQQLGRLLQQVREDAQAAFQRAAPLAAGLDGTARLREASRLTGLRPRELMQAFTGNVSTHHEFSNAVRTLAAFRRRLARRSQPEGSR